MRHYFIYILALTACLTIAGCSDDASSHRPTLTKTDS